MQKKLGLALVCLLILAGCSPVEESGEEIATVDGGGTTSVQITDKEKIREPEQIENVVTEEIAQATYFDADVSGQIELDNDGEISILNINGNMKYDVESNVVLLSANISVGEINFDLRVYTDENQEIISAFGQEMEDQLSEQQKEELRQCIANITGNGNSIPTTNEFREEGDHRFLKIVPADEVKKELLKTQPGHIIVGSVVDAQRGDVDIETIEVTYVMDKSNNLELIEYYIIVVDYDGQPGRIVFNPTLKINSLNDAFEINTPS